MILKEKIESIVNKYRSGFYVEAETLANNLIKKNIDDYQLINIYGLILVKLKKVETAIKNFQRSVKIKPDFFDGHFNSAVAYNILGKYDNAILSLKECLKINSQSIHTLIFVGSLYLKLNQEKTAKKYYNDALKINPKYYMGYYSLANLYKKANEYEKAITNYKLSIEYNDKDFASFNNLATLYQTIGKFDLAISNFESAIKINPKFSSLYQNYLYCLNFSKHYDLNLYTDLVEKFRKSLPKIDFSKINASKKNNNINKKIKVGFISGDFGQHPVSYYLLSTIKYINNEAFELVAYSNSNRMDTLTLELKKNFNLWRDINHLNDIEAINLIKKDSIDILFDLSGYTAKNRLSIFINKPAPVQVTWLGYNASTGLKEIDYILVDQYVVPNSDQKYFSEKIFQLPNTFQCILINDNVDVETKDYQKEKEIIFGSFNSLAKINDDVILLWSEILNKIYNSKLFLKSSQLDDVNISKSIKEKFKKNKIDYDRIITEGRSSKREDMLRRYNKVDIALDPFPYPGITTSLEAIWMGVPLLTKKGNNFYSRIGTSINKNLDMEDWIAEDENDYIAKAIKKSSNLNELFKVKKELRNKFLQSPLGDAREFAKKFQNSLNLMWKNYLENNAKI